MFTGILIRLIKKIGFIMRKINVLGRITAFILAVILIFTAMPLTALADNGDNSLTDGYGSFIDGAQVIKDIISNYGENQHPRIIMTEEKFAKLRTYVKDGQVVNDGSVTAALLIELKGEADNYYSAGIPPYEVDSEGHILEYSKRIQRYVATLALVYNIFGDEKYAKRCYEVMESACKSADEFGTWDPHHFLDTAEMCTGLAYGYDWIYNYMDENQRKLIRDAIIEKGFNQVMNDYEKKVKYNPDATKLTDRSYVWYGSEKGDNWMFVCTGGLNLAALAIGDEADAKDIASKVLDYGYKKAYTAVRQGYDTIDGTYVEGLGYWDYATYYLGLQSSALISATGTDYGLTDHEGLRKSVDFVRYMSSNYPYSFSFGDDGDSRDTGWPVFLWLGEHYNSPEMATIRLRKISEDPEFRYLDVLWIDESKQTDSVYTNSTDWGAVGAKNASFRNTWDISGLVAALHTGENDLLYHGHFDLGSFYIESNGARFFTDLGNEDYYLKDREYSYRIKPEGHNTLVINPTSGTDQRDKVTCTITDYNSGNEAYAVTDLTEAYSDNGASSVIRGLKMIKDKECVIIQDEISLNKAGEIYWFAHTKGTIDVASDGRSAIVTVGSERMWVGLLSDGGKLTAMDAIPLSTSKNVPNATSNNGYTKLAIHLTNTKDATISVACIPLKSGESAPSWTPSVRKISEWSTGSESVHTHEGTKVDKIDATCSLAGTKEYYECTCGEYFEDADCTKKIEDIEAWAKIEPLGHDFTIEYSGYDENNHWHICKREGCEAIDNVSAHYGGVASVAGKAVCEACGQAYGEALKTPEVKAPVVNASVSYDPEKALNDYSLDVSKASATCEGEKVTGSWSWKNSDEVPMVSKNTYTATFTPDSELYIPVDAEVTMNVTKAAVDISSAPSVSAITYGQSIADSKITDGKASVEGIFAWAADDAVINPTVAESEKNTYTVEFRPTDSVNYEITTVEVSVKVAKAENAPNMPVASMNPSFDVKKVSENALPDGWKWAATDENGDLQAGVTYNATAVYVGSDAGNYVNETVVIAITRSMCAHEVESELRDVKEATCSVEGYTGDEYCSKCGELIKKGTSIDTLPHTGGTATCTSKKICTVCETPYGEVDPSNHVEVEIRNKKEASCSEDGYTGDTYCKACNKLITEGSVSEKAKGHSYESKVTTEPTYDEEGVVTFTCSLCGDTYTEKTDKRPLDIPCLKDDANIRGWEAIKEYLSDVNSGEIEVEMNGNFIVPADVLKLFAGEDVEITFKAKVESEDISWTVNGKDISAETITDVDIRNVPELEDPEVDEPEIDEPVMDEPEIDEPVIDEPGTVEDVEQPAAKPEDTKPVHTDVPKKPVSSQQSASSQQQASQTNNATEVAKTDDTKQIAQDNEQPIVHTNVPKKSATQTNESTSTTTSGKSTNKQLPNKNTKTPASGEVAEVSSKPAKTEEAQSASADKLVADNDEIVIIAENPVPASDATSDSVVKNADGNNSAALPIVGGSLLLVLVGIVGYVIKRRRSY